MPEHRADIVTRVMRSLEETTDHTSDSDER